MYKIGNIIEYAKEHGFLGLPKAAFRKFVFHREKHVLTCLSLAEPLPVLQPLQNIAFRKASLADRGELIQLIKEERYSQVKKEFHKWIKKDYFFLLAIAEDKIMGYCCVSKDIPSKYRAIKGINFKDDDAWGQDAFVHPRYRGNNVYPVLAIEALKSAAAAGYRRIYGEMTSSNFSSRCAHQKIGCKEIREITLSKILFFKTCY